MSEARYRALFEQAGVGVAQVDSETGRFLRVNRRCAEIAGYSVAEMEALDFQALADPGDLQGWMARLADLRSGRIRQFTLGMSCLPKSGERVWVELTVTPLWTEGEPPGCVEVVAQDVTARKRAEEAAQAGEANYRALFEAEPDAILIVDIDSGRIVDANPSATRLYGYEHEELCRMKALDLSAEPERSATHIAATAREAEGGPEAPVARRRHRRKDGIEFPVEISHGFYVRDGRRMICALMRDMTERQRAEEERERLQAQLLQAQKMESIGRLAGGVAHDLNNLLTPVLAYSDMLLAEIPEGDPRRARVQGTLEAGLRARDLVHQLLAFGRKQILEIRTVDLNAVVASFAGLLRRTIREDIHIETELGPGAMSVRADVGQIEQVIMNLAVNAQDAMPGGGTLTIETAQLDLDRAAVEGHPELVPGRYVLLNISDDGHGMDAAVQEQLFTPFFTTKEQGRGTGLGLATAYGIVRQHGGTIRVRSAPAQGTMFGIYLPVALAPEGKAGAETPEASEAPGGSETIMVVEDHDMVRSLVVSMLEQLGYRALSASGGPECLRLLQEQPEPLHLLLTDVVMPAMNGRELFERLAERFPGIRVLYMSGYTENVIGHQGVLDEGVHLIQKPFSAQRLAAKLREVLGGGSPP